MVVSGAVLGIGDKVCKSNDEIKLGRDESFLFYVLMTCHSRYLWCACAHIFQKQQLGELFGADTLNRAYVVFIKIENYVCIRITCIYTPLYSLLYR